MQNNKPQMLLISLVSLSFGIYSFSYFLYSASTILNHFWEGPIFSSFTLLYFSTFMCWIGIYVSIFSLTRFNKYRILAIISLVLSSPTFVGSILVISPILDK
jgi:hypothetical protein